MTRYEETADLRGPDLRGPGPTLRQHATEAAAQAETITLDAQGGDYPEWFQNPHMVEFYALSVEMLRAHAGRVDAAAYEQQSYDIFRAFAPLAGGRSRRHDRPLESHSARDGRRSSRTTPRCSTATRTSSLRCEALARRRSLVRGCAATSAFTAPAWATRSSAAETWLLSVGQDMSPRRDAPRSATLQPRPGAERAVNPMQANPSKNPAQAPDLFGYRKYWAHRLTPAPFLPMSREEMDLLGWDQCDVILVTGDAYVDHPSFGMAIVGRVLEAQGFRVGIIAQPDWRSTADFERLGAPALFFGITAGNMDSMVNRYTADKRVRSDDAYTPGGVGGQRPDRSVIVYAQRVREAFADAPIVIGGIEASLRRIAHFDYWQEKVRRSILLDARADLLVFGNGERQIVEIAHRLAAGETTSRAARHSRNRAARRRAATVGPRSTRRISTRPAPSPAIPTPMRWSPRSRRPRSETPSPACTSCASRGACRRQTAPAVTSGCRASSKYATTPCSTRTRRGSCTWSRTPATHVRSCSGTARATSG